MLVAVIQESSCSFLLQLPPPQLPVLLSSTWVENFNLTRIFRSTDLHSHFQLSVTDTHLLRKWLQGLVASRMNATWFSSSLVNMVCRIVLTELFHYSIWYNSNNWIQVEYWWTATNIWQLFICTVAIQTNIQSYYYVLYTWILIAIVSSYCILAAVYSISLHLSALEWWLSKY
jgi:hypothetical protein